MFRAAAVLEILGNRDALAGVRLADETMTPADDVLVAIGSVPNTEWLAADDLSVHNGLLCDEYCAAAPGVYGVGDVARWHNPLFGTDMRVEHRTNAAEQGMAVARTILGDPRPFAPVPYFGLLAALLLPPADAFRNHGDQRVLLATKLDQTKATTSGRRARMRV